MRTSIRIVALAVAFVVASSTDATAVPPPYHAASPALQVIAAPTGLSYTTDGTKCGSILGPIISLACAGLSNGGVLLYWAWASCKDANCVQGIDGFHVYHRIGGASGLTEHTNRVAAPVKTVDNPAQDYTVLDSARPGDCFQVTAYKGSAESDASATLCLPNDLSRGGSTISLAPATNEIRSAHQGLIYDTGASLAVGDVPMQDEELGKIHVGYSYNTDKGVTDSAINNLYRGAFAFDLGALQGKAITSATLHLHVVSTELGMPQQPNYNTSCARHLGLGTDQWWYATGWIGGDFNWDLSSHGPDIQIDVTDAVRGWVQLGKENDGFVLKGADENIMAFTEDSCESYYDVSLDVTYL